MPDTIKSGSATAFLDTLGVNIHLASGEASYDNSSLMLRDVHYLGINNVRSVLPDSSAASATATIGALAAGGLHFDLVTSSALPATGTDGLNKYVAALGAFDTAHPGQISAVEGLNEANIYNFSWQGDSSMAGAVSFQKALYTDVHASSALKGVGVINLSVGYESKQAYAQVGNLSSWADYSNSHAYTDTVQSQTQSMAVSIANANGAAVGKPLVITETGYTTDLSSTYLGVSQTAQAKLILDNLFNAFQDGTQKTYLYELFNSNLDPSGPSSEQNYGLFNADGTPKLAATAIHNLTTILSSGATASAPSVAAGSWSLEGAPTGVHSLALAKSAGTYDIALWSDTSAWNQATMTDAKVTPTSTTVDFGSKQSNVYVYDPMVGTAPVAVYHNVSSVTVQLGANPLIVEVGASAPVSVGPTTAAAHLSTTAGALIAGIDQLAQTTGTQSITLTDTHDLPVSTVNAMQDIIAHDGTVLSKIQGGYDFVVDQSTDQWREVQTFDSAGHLMSTTNYAMKNGTAISSTTVNADGSSISRTNGSTTENTGQTSKQTLANGTVILSNYAVNGTLTSARTTATDGNVWTSTFDNTGHKLTDGHTAPDGSSTQVAYNPSTGQKQTVYEADVAGDHFTTTYQNGAVQFHYVTYADGHTETLQYGISGQDYVTQDQQADATGRITSVMRYHADGSLEGAQTYAADGNSWQSSYNSAGKLLSAVHTAPDASSTTTTYDPSTGAVTKTYAALADGDKLTDYYTGGKVTTHYDVHANGETEFIQYGVVGQSYTTLDEKIGANGHIETISRFHADGTYDYLESDGANGQRDVNLYGSTGKLAEMTHYATDGSWTSTFLPTTSGGDTRVEQHSADKVHVLVTITHADGTSTHQSYGG